jgi:DHA1 family inner membrane transport protein
MTIGTVVGGRLADRSVLGTVIGSMIATIVVLVAIALVGAYPVPGRARAGPARRHVAGARAVPPDPADGRVPAAPSLGAALCHSALNLGNAAGAFVGGLVIAAGFGYLAPAWVGAALTALGLVVVLVFGRGAVPIPSAPARPEDRARDLTPELSAR